MVKSNSPPPDDGFLDSVLRESRMEPIQPAPDCPIGRGSPDPRAETAGFDTEGLLNSMIRECHFLMRHAAFPSICMAKDPLDRMRFMQTAMEFATTAARLADSVTRFRGGDRAQEVRHRMLYEHVQTGPLPPPKAAGL